MDSIAVYEPLHDGFMASPSDLLALRGMLLADRVKHIELIDFEFLLKKAARRGSPLPRLDRTTVEALKEATALLSRVNALVLIWTF